MSQLSTPTRVEKASAGFDKLTAGLTPASLTAGFFCMLMLSILTHYTELILGIAFPAEHSLALPVIWIFLLLVIIVGLVRVVAGVVLLSRQERLCVLYAMLIAAPLMTQGFWHRFIAVIATNPRAADWEKIDAMNDKLWPHGPNVTAGLLARDGGGELTFRGTYSWETIEFDEGRSAELPVLSNTAKEGESAVRIKIPLRNADEKIISLGDPHMVSVLLRAVNLGADAAYFGRIYADDSSNFVQFLSSSAPPKKTFLHRTGFQRLGQYGVKVPPEAVSHVWLEFGLKGQGRLELTDPKFFNVSTLEGVFKGRVLIAQKEFDKLPESERAGMVVRPDNMWSPAGVWFLMQGYIPIRDWLVPMAVWTSFVSLLLIGMLAVVSIMRRQWLENERYSLPLSRVPESLADPSANAGAVSSIWRNRLMWSGFAISLIYVLLRAAAFYNSSWPDPTIRISIKEYVSNPMFGSMFDSARLELNMIFLSLCMFMELNVLISLVLGYWIFRAQGWFGEATKANLVSGFSWAYEQTMAAYIAYGGMVLIFARKYLGQVLKAAVTGDRAASAGDVMTYRAAILLLLSVFFGVVLWSLWLGIGVAGMLVFFLFLLLVGFVCAKFRAEAGFPWGYMAPGNFALVLTLLGGVSLFGGEAMIFCYIASFFLAPTVFFLIPGAQLELIELGRKWQVRKSHIVMTVVLAILGGMLVGGWGFLSNTYALGGETLRYNWAFDSKPWYFFSYNSQMNAATNDWLATQNAAGAVAPDAPAATGIDPVWYAYGFAAGGTVIISLLRQAFAGFWFHPIGWVLGTTANTGAILDYIWGSALIAWVIRGSVLWLGGGQTVRKKLQPFFIGVFLGAVIAELVIGVHGIYLRSINVQNIFPVLQP